MGVDLGAGVGAAVDDIVISSSAGHFGAPTGCESKCEAAELKQMNLYKLPNPTGPGTTVLGTLH